MTAKKNINRAIWSSDSHWQPPINTLFIISVALFTFGMAEGLLVLAALGASPWTVLAEGMSLQTGLDIGWCTFLVSSVVILMWIPLKQQLGLGTILNIVFISGGLSFAVNYLPAPHAFWARCLLGLLGITVIGMSSALYLTCHMGAGPRDGLMVGLYQKTGYKVGVIRTSLEITVCFIGWCLGGAVGLTTLLFAIGVGWVLQWSLSVIARYFPARRI